MFSKGWDEPDEVASEVKCVQSHQQVLHIFRQGVFLSHSASREQYGPDLFGRHRERNIEPREQVWWFPEIKVEHHV